MWLTNHGHCTGIQSLITGASLLQTSEEWRNTKKTKTKTKAAKRYLGTSNNTSLGFIQCYLPAINCHRNIAVFGTEHSDFT